MTDFFNANFPFLENFSFIFIFIVCFILNGRINIIKMLIIKKRYLWNKRKKQHVKKCVGTKKIANEKKGIIFCFNW